MASTYPLEVVRRTAGPDEQEAQGRRAQGGGGKQAWDESVKQLAATPSVLDMMSTHSNGRRSSAMPCWRSRPT